MNDTVLMVALALGAVYLLTRKNGPPGSPTSKGGVSSLPVPSAGRGTPSPLFAPTSGTGAGQLATDYAPGRGPSGGDRAKGIITGACAIGTTIAATAYAGPAGTAVAGAAAPGACGLAVAGTIAAGKAVYGAGKATVNLADRNISKVPIAGSIYKTGKGAAKSAIHKLNPF